MLTISIFWEVFRIFLETNKICGLSDPDRMLVIRGGGGGGGGGGSTLAGTSSVFLCIHHYPPTNTTLEKMEGEKEEKATVLRSKFDTTKKCKILLCECS